MLNHLRALKATELRRLATEIGVHSSGNKNVLGARINDALLDFKDAQSSGVSKTITPGQGDPRPLLDHHILSIDMGLRNLAFCRMSISTASIKPGLGNTNDKNQVNFDPQLPKLHNWSRLTVSEAPADADVKEVFDSSTLSKYANDLVENLALSQTRLPDTVLIERQRFRTMGAPSIQEWTLRVNVFEAMLWAVFEAAKRNGKWSGEIISMDPILIAKWCDNLEGSNSSDPPETLVPSKTNRTKLIKKKKIQIAKTWLNESNNIEITKPVRQTVDQFMSSSFGIRKASPLGKIDDMADTLVQAMAWLSCKNVPT